MDRLDKKNCADRLRESVCESPYMLIVMHSGLNAQSISGFRRQVRDVGATFKVVKNTLAKKALGQEPEFLKAFRFSTAVLLSKDPIALSKVSVEFAKEQKERFQIVLGRLDGAFLSSSEIFELSSLPSLEELRGSFLSILSGAASRLLSVLQAPAQGVVRVFSAYEKNKI